MSAALVVIADAMTGNPALAHMPLESAWESATVDAKRENHAPWLMVNAAEIAVADASKASHAPWPEQYVRWDVTAGATMASHAPAAGKNAARDVIAAAMTASPAHVHMPEQPEQYALRDAPVVVMKPESVRWMEKCVKQAVHAAVTQGNPVVWLRRAAKIPQLQNQKRQSLQYSVK